MAFAAITSLMNLFEAPVEALQAQLGLSRAVSVGIVAVIAVAVGLFLENGSSVSDWMDVISDLRYSRRRVFRRLVMFFWSALAASLRSRRRRAAPSRSAAGSTS